MSSNITYSVLRLTRTKMILYPDSLACSYFNEPTTSSKHAYLQQDNAFSAFSHIMVWKKLQGKWYIHLHIFSSSKKGEKGIGPREFSKNTFLVAVVK